MSHHNFPEPGTPADLSFYYNYNWFTPTVVLGEKDGFAVTNATCPITLSKGQDPVTQKIGDIMVPEFVSANNYNDTFIVYFSKEAGGGTITFVDNQALDTDLWGPNLEQVFEITGGSGNYMFSNGFVVVKTDDKLGREIFVYFFK